MNHFPCPCCGHVVFEESLCWEICPICFWEDDPVQVADPWFEGGANKPSLIQAQQNYKSFGAMERRFTSNVRKPTKSDRKDPAWRLVLKSDKVSVTTPKSIEENAEKTGISESYYYWERSSN